MSDESREQRLAGALADYLERRARGEPIDTDGFCTGFGDLAPDLRAQIETSVSFDWLDETEPGVQPVPALAEPPPDRLSGYRILRELGSGGMGRVFLASDERLGREVAIKTLKPAFRADAALRRRFLDEARAMARLAHPGVIRIYELGSEAEDPHFVMEYVQGVPLTQAARRLELRSRIELFRKVVAAVSFLHQNEILHRDLKPANVLVDAAGEPRLLDFGLALPLREEGRMTQAGAVLGTPAYLSPEQAAGERNLDARSDVFALGAMLYELLTNALPFPQPNLPDQLRAIREQDPVLPRRLSPGLPGGLQNICLKALEKDPSERYASAQPMAEDLDRFLAGEPVLATPVAYARLLAGQRERHVVDVDGWHRDHLITDGEHDSLRRSYDRLVEREDAWLLEARRLSLSQVILYFGAWLLVVSGVIIVTLRVSGLNGIAAPSAVSLAAALAGAAGIRLWRRQEWRIALAFLLAFCALIPAALIAAMTESGVLGEGVKGREWIAGFPPGDGWKPVTNAQFWWALTLSLPVYLWLRRFTRSSSFTMAAATALAALFGVTMLRMGLLEWLEKDPGRLYFHMIPAALLYFAVAFILERARLPLDSRYFYPFAVGFTYFALSGVALFHEPYRHWLERSLPWTRGQIEYLFLFNAAAYLVLQAVCDLIPSPQMRTVAKAFRFVLPGHVLISLLLLGMAASGKPGLEGERRAFEILLPLASSAFVFLSIPKQMKNFIVSGLFFLAVGLVRLQQNLWRDQGLWPVLLLLGGVALMTVAAQYTKVKLLLRRLHRR
jgi:predicted Ser/Thr protein kinase